MLWTENSDFWRKRFRKINSVLYLKRDLTFLFTGESLVPKSPNQMEAYAGGGGGVWRGRQQR